jgi:hypothetical protein
LTAARRITFAGGTKVWTKVGQHQEAWVDFVELCANLLIDPTNPEWASPVREAGAEDTYAGEFDTAALWYLFHDEPARRVIEFVQVTFYNDYLN